LYKAQNSRVTKIKKNQATGNWFYRFRENGIIPRNDLLKAQLQVSKVQLSLDRSADLKMSILN
jgi:hypothetical protein